MCRGRLWFALPEYSTPCQAVESDLLSCSDRIEHHIISQLCAQQLEREWRRLSGMWKDEPHLNWQGGKKMTESYVPASFLSPLVRSAPNIFDNKHQDPTGLSALLQSTDLVGVVHTLYCILLHGFLPEMASPRQELYDPGVIQVALQGIRFLNSFALLDLSAFQVFKLHLDYFLIQKYLVIIRVCMFTIANLFIVACGLNILIIVVTC